MDSKKDGFLGRCPGSKRAGAKPFRAGRANRLSDVEPGGRRARERGVKRLGGGRWGWHFPTVQDARTARRRWCGLLFLILAGGMTIWGLTWLEPRLRAGAFVVYWLVCAGFVLLAMLVAGIDLLIVIAAARRQRRELFRRAAASEPEKPPREDGTLHLPGPPVRS